MFYLLGRGFRYLFYGVDFLLFTAVLYPLSFFPRALLERFYPTLFRRWCRSFVRALGVELRLHQKNRKPLPKTYLLIGNHPSAFEDIGIPALFPVFSLAKIEVRDWWVVGRISRAAGTLYVRREDRDSRRAAAREIEAVLQQGRNVAVYPEGGCKGRRIFERFHFGVFEISLKTGIPILPVFLHYEAQESFEWAPGETLLQKIYAMLRAQNKRVNYYVYDAFDPGRYRDKEEYARDAREHYLAWQARYLD
ncbi:MAG: lysophospholipid acyltransferase family protein [Gammaproteobacteria bacterium]